MYNVGSKRLFQQGISETEFYGDLVHRRIVGSPDISNKSRILPFDLWVSEVYSSLEFGLVHWCK